MSSTDREPEVSEPPPPDGGPAAWPPQEAAPPDEGPKTEAKTEAKAEGKAEEKTEPKAEEKTEAKTEEKTEAKTEARTEEKTDGSAAAASIPETQAETAPAGEKPAAAKVEPTSAAPGEADEPKPEAAQGAALPAEEMPFSNSTLHWLDDADQAQEEDPSHRITVPGYDPTAPVAGRKRAVMVVGGAAALALVITGVLYLMAPRRPVAVEAASAEPARELTARAETALAANKIGEAVDLARLALVADARFADAHFVVGMCDKARNEVPGAREELRRYLELAPLGTHAAAAREALAALPQ
jgi:hypothetical protein